MRLKFEDLRLQTYDDHRYSDFPVENQQTWSGPTSNWVLGCVDGVQQNHLYVLDVLVRRLVSENVILEVIQNHSIARKMDVI